MYEKVPIFRFILLDGKMLQQAGNAVAIFDVGFLSEIRQELTMAFSVKGYESSKLKQIFFFES